MERLRKHAILCGDRGCARKVAIIDTGIKRAVVPRKTAESVGARPTGRRGTLKILGKTYSGEIMRMNVCLPAGDCEAEAEAFVPDGNQLRKTIVGSRFLQETGATIVYKGKHPVFCNPTYLDNGLGLIEFEEDDPKTSRRRK